jgi:neutral ceramidase
MVTLRAGCAKADITPPVGTTMDGFAARILPSEGIHDRLHCRAVVLDDGAHSVALASCDVCWFTESIVQEVRERIAVLGVDQLILAATHNHSGPLMADFLVGPNTTGSDYVRNLPATISNTIGLACDKLEKASLAIGRGKVSVSVNRRSATGETDTDVITVILRSEAGRPMAGILNYACHPTVLGQENRQISADFPGSCAESIERDFGPEFVCLFLNGACGDVNPQTCLGYDCRGTFADVREMTAKLVNTVIGKPQFEETQGFKGIRFAKTNVGPLGPFGLKFEMSALALSNVVVLGIPGEILTSTGLWLKKHSGVPNLMMACYANGYVGYIPTDDAFVAKDYETKSVCWVEKGAEEEVRARARVLVERISREEFG